MIIDFNRLNWLINRQISSTIEYYRLIDYIFDDRFLSIRYVLIKHAHDGSVVRTDYKLVQFQLQQLYGEIVQLQSALNDDYNSVQEKSNMYHISEPIIRRFFPKRVLLCSLSSSFHWFSQLCKETLQHFARFWRLFRSVMWSILVPLKFLFSFFPFFLIFFLNSG